MKNAIRIKQINPQCQIYVLYQDLITYGYREAFYTEARERGALFMRYNEDKRPTVRVVNEELQVVVDELVLGTQMILKPDLVALSMATVPADSNAHLARLLGVPLSREGFFMEAHLKLRPMDFIPDGIFLCGLAHYPKFIEETIAHALASAGRALSILARPQLESGGVVASVDESKCVACLTCVRTCPFDVPVVDSDRTGIGAIKGAAYIDPALCQGCGTCTSECPASAIQLAHYRDDQIVLCDADILGRWQA
jgi:heterodisulfide reductase subunit A-like polyferredoxin